jgi:hypothetical protein
MSEQDEIERLYDEAEAAHEAEHGPRSAAPGRTRCPHCGQRWPRSVRRGDKVACTCGREATA